MQEADRKNLTAKNNSRGQLQKTKCRDQLQKTNSNKQTVINRQ